MKKLNVVPVNSFQVYCYMFEK